MEFPSEREDTDQNHTSAEKADRNKGKMFMLEDCSNRGRTYPRKQAFSFYPNHRVTTMVLM